MCCGGLFKKKASKKHGAAGGAGFAPRPMQQVVQSNGRVGYQAATGAPTHPEYGAEFDEDVRRRKEQIQMGAKVASRMGPQGKVVGTVAKHGAGFAAEKIVEQQYKSRQAAQLAQQKAELEAGKEGAEY